MGSPSNPPSDSESNETTTKTTQLRSPRSWSRSSSNSTIRSRRNSGSSSSSDVRSVDITKDDDDSDDLGVIVSKKNRNNVLEDSSDDEIIDKKDGANDEKKSSNETEDEINGDRVQDEDRPLSIGDNIESDEIKVKTNIEKGDINDSEVESGREESLNNDKDPNIQSKASLINDSSDDNRDKTKTDMLRNLKNSELFDPNGSESETNSVESKRKKKKYLRKSRGSGTKGSDSSGDESKPERTKNSKKKKTQRPKRDAMLEIRAASQRRAREAAIELPYHVPKQVSLEDFLNRKKNAPELVKSLMLKTTINRMDEEEATQILLERQKIVEEFYVSDPEENCDDENDDDPDYDPSNKASENNDKEDTGQKVNEEEELEKSINHEVDHSKENNDKEDTSQKVNEEEELEKSINHEVDPSKEDISENSVDITNERGENEEKSCEKGPEESKDNSEETESLKLVLESESMELGKQAEENDLRSKSSILSRLSKKFDLSHLNERLALTPKLGTGLDINDQVIDLEDNEKDDSALQNFQSRLGRHLVKKKQEHTMQKITVVRKQVSDNGTESLKVETIKYEERTKKKGPDFLEVVEKAKRSHVPGAQILALKSTLKEKIWEKRKIEREKKSALRKMDNEDYNEGDVLLDDEEEFEDFDEEEEEEEEDSSGESEPESEPEIKEKSSRIKSVYLDEEAEEDTEVQNDEEMGTLALEEEEDEEGGGEEKTKERLEGTPTTTTTPKTPFLTQISDPRWTPFDQREDEKDDEIEEGQNLVRKKLGFEDLLDSSDPKVDDFGDVISLCSGQFLTQPQVLEPSQDDDEKSLSGTPETVMDQGKERDTQDTVILEESDGGRVISISDLNSDEDDDDFGTFKKKRKQRVLSDDSDNNSEAESVKEEEEIEAIDEQVEIAEEEDVAYDSEENEIPAAQKMVFGDKHGRLRKEFIENEAELSGSEVASEDEDERGLDRLEMEEGDLEEIDEEKVRDEVGKIHHNQVLAEDKRDVRLFQEAFLEDGDLHSDKTRQRSFKWKNNDEGDDDDNERRGGSDEEIEDEENDENTDAGKLRLEKLEREKWLLEQSKKLRDGEDGDDETEIEAAVNEESQFFNMANKVLKKLNQKKKESVTEPGKKVPTSPKPKIPLQLLMGNKDNNKRGSFLSRDPSMLDKLAEMAKSKTDNSGTGVKQNSKHFLFTTVSPTKKRELADNDEDELKKERLAAIAKKKKSFSGEPLKKKPRTLSQNNDTIFGLM